jgi:hypothetical protein
MATTDRPSGDPRNCPRCGARGILPLDQPREPSGAIPDPVMICPVCGDEFRAEGMTSLGFWNVGTMTEEEIHEMAVKVVNRLRVQRRASEGLEDNE